MDLQSCSLSDLEDSAECLMCKIILPPPPLPPPQYHHSIKIKKFMCLPVYSLALSSEYKYVTTCHTFRTNNQYYPVFPEQFKK